MAIKGKKKSRGSQARRRPASAPRPVVGVRQKTPWYNTPAGRVIAALSVVAVIAVIGTSIAIKRGNDSDKAERLEAVEDYTAEIETIVQSATPPVGEMAAITPASPAEQLSTLKETAEGWATDIEAASTRLTAVVPPSEVEKINPFFPQTFQLYVNSARLLVNAGDAEGKVQADLITRSTEIRASAEQGFASAVALLDDVLIELGGDPSGLQSPGVAGAAGAQTIPTAPGGGGGGQGGGGQGQGGGGQGEGGGGQGGQGEGDGN